MSRIGKKPVALVNGVSATLSNGQLDVKGPKGTLTIKVPEIVTVSVQAEEILVERQDDTRRSRAFHGLVRSLIQNMVIGVTEGYKKDLTIVGIGYRAAVQGAKLVLNVGFSHPVEVAIPSTVKVTVNENTKITVEGSDKQQVGELAAQIRRVRPPEPYKGKGIRYADENVRQKEGKTVG